MSISNRQIIQDGLWDNNAVWSQLLGMCPTLAITTSAINGFGMGMATAGVLAASNVVVSMIRNFIPNDVRIPAYIMVIATMVTVTDLGMNAYVHDLHKVLGIYIPLIVVNCVVLGRAEAFAAKNGIFQSFLDGAFTGFGFTLALTSIGAVREIIGSGSLLGIPLFGPDFHQVIVFVLPPGAFIALAMTLMVVKTINNMRGNK